LEVVHYRQTKTHKTCSHLVKVESSKWKPRSKTNNQEHKKNITTTLQNKTKEAISLTNSNCAAPLFDKTVPQKCK